MHRIDTATKATDLFGAGKHGFKDGDKALGIAATDLTAAFFNDVQENIAGIIESAGIALAKGDGTQLRLAITKMIQSGQRSVIFNNCTFAGAVTGAGKVVYWDSANSRFDLALADGSAKQSAVGFADVPNGNVYAFGDAVLFAGLTPGRYYLDTATAGAITSVMPALANVVFLGIAKNATEIFVDIDAAPTISQTISAMRQTVLSGPVDANGYPAFGGATGGTTVTVAGTLIPSAANGFSANGQVDQAGSILNPSWTGLNTNGTMFLYLDIAANGTCTTGSTTLEPVYQFGGAYSTTNNQHTFNTQEMKMKVGNGAAATQVNRVFCGEVTVAGGVVSAITWYGLMGRYDSGLFSATTNTTYSKSHNLGMRQFCLEVTIADDANGTNERPATSLYNTTLTAARGIFAGASSRNAAAIVTSTGSVGANTSGTDVSTAYFRIRARRAF